MANPFNLEPPSFVPQQKASFAENLAKGTAELGSQAVSGLVGAGGNIVKGLATAADIVNPVNIFSRATGIGQPVDIAQTLVKPITAPIEWEQQAIKKSMQAGGFNPESGAGKFGYGLGQITATIPAAIAGGAIGQAIGKALPAALTSFPTAQAIASKAMPFLGMSFGSTEAATMATQGRPATAMEAGIGLGTDLIFAGVGKAFKALKGEKTTGQALYEAAIPKTAKEAELAQRSQAGLGFAPRTAADTARELGIAGTEEQIGVKALQEANRINKEIVKPALQSAPAKFDIKSTLNQIQGDIMQEADLGRRRDLLEALGVLKDEYKYVPRVSFERAQAIKQSLDQFTPQKAFRGKDIAGAYGQVKNLFADSIRQQTYNLLPDNTLKNAYLDLGNLIQIAQHGQKAMTGQLLKGGFGGFVSSLKSAAITPALTTAGKIAERTKVFTPYIESIAQTLPSAAKAMIFGGRTKTLK